MEETPALPLSGTEDDWRHLRNCACRVVGPDGAEDVAQEVYLAIAEGRLRPPPAAGRSWWMGVARNYARTFLRGEIRRYQREQTAAPPRGGTPDPWHEWAQRESLAALAQAIEALGTIQRRVVEMICIDGRNQQDVARDMGIPRATVASHLSRARQELRRRLHRVEGPSALLLLGLLFDLAAAGDAAAPTGETCEPQRADDARPHPRGPVARGAAVGAGIIALALLAACAWWLWRPADTAGLPSGSVPTPLSAMGAAALSADREAPAQAGWPEQLPWLLPDGRPSEALLLPPGTTPVRGVAMVVPPGDGDRAEAQLAAQLAEPLRRRNWALVVPIIDGQHAQYAAIAPALDGLLDRARAVTGLSDAPVLAVGASFGGITALQWAAESRHAITGVLVHPGVLLNAETAAGLRGVPVLLLRRETDWEAWLQPLHQTVAHLRKRRAQLRVTQVPGRGHVVRLEHPTVDAWLDALETAP